MSQTNNVEVTLVIRSPGTADRKVTLGKQKILLGRAPECDVVLEEATAGREHCRLEVSPEGTCRLHDLGTHVGTLLNGNRVEKQLLAQNGDIIAIGQTTIDLKIKRPQEAAAKAGTGKSSKAQHKRRPVLHVMQLWGDRILAVNQFENTAKHLVPTAALIVGLLFVQVLFLWNFYFGLKSLYMDGVIDDYTPQLVSAVVVFILADIAALLMTFDIVKWPRNAQLKSVTIGAGRKQDFFVPEEMLGAPSHKLVTLYKGQPALDLSSPAIKGKVLIDGQVLSIDELMKTSLIKEKHYLPLNLKTRAKLEIGQTSFLVHMDPQLVAPKGALLHHVDVPMFVSASGSFFVVILLLLAVMAAPRNQPIKRTSVVNTKTFATLIRAEKEKKQLQEEKKEEQKEEEKKEEEKKPDEKVLPTEVETAPTNQDKPVDVKNEPVKVERRVVKQAPKQTVKTTLTNPKSQKKFLSMSTPKKSSSKRPKGVLAAFEDDRMRAISSKHGEAMAAPHLTDIDGLAVKGGPGGEDSVFVGADSGGSGDIFEMDRYADKGNGADGFGAANPYGDSVDGSGNVVGGGRQPIRGGYLAELDKGNIQKGAAKAGGFKEKKPGLRLPDSVSSSGKLSKDLVMQVLRREAPRLRACYSKAIQADDKLEGKMIVTFVVSPDGKVIKVTIDNSEIPNDAMKSCVVDTVRTFIFPKPEDGRPVQVTRYPFIFHKQ